MRNQYFGKVIWRRLIAASITLAIFTGVVSAGTKTWSGGDNNDSNWTSNGNWSGIGGAGRNDDLVFPAGAARLTNFNDFPTNTSFDSLNFKGRGYNISGSQIFLESGVHIDIPAGAVGSTSFNPNIILGSSQFWTSVQGFVIFNGVVNLNSFNLVANTTGGTLVMNGLINGSGSITKQGAAALIINGNASGFGATFLNQGTVQVGGTLGHVVLNDGDLAGTGTVASVAANSLGSGGSISPGNGATSIGTLNFAGLVSLNSAKTVSIDLKDFGNDQVRVTGNNIDLNNADLDVVLGFTPAVGRQFTIISQIGAGVVTGQFSQGSAIVANSQLFTITYTASSVVLTAQGPVGP